MKLFDRINISKIFIKHIDTLYDYGIYKATGKKKIPASDMLTFLILPAVFSIILYISGIKVTEDYVNIMITALSIFVGLLFGLLTMVFDLAKREKEIREEQKEKYQHEDRYQLTQELFINTAFSIALSIMAIITLLLTQLRPEPVIAYLQQYCWYPCLKTAWLLVFNITAFFLVIEFLATLLMILKRFFLLYLDQFSK